MIARAQGDDSYLLIAELGPRCCFWCCQHYIALKKVKLVGLLLKMLVNAENGSHMPCCLGHYCYTWLTMWFSCSLLIKKFIWILDITLKINNKEEEVKSWRERAAQLIEMSSSPSTNPGASSWKYFFVAKLIFIILSQYNFYNYGLSTKGLIYLYRQSNGQMIWSIDHWNVCTTKDYSRNSGSNARNML